MSGTDLPRLVWRGLATWLLLSLLGWFWAQPLLGWFIPSLKILEAERKWSEDF